MKKKSFTDEQLRKALFSFQDMMERLTCPFYPLRNTAKEVREEDKLTGEIWVGVRQREWMESRRRTFKTILERDRIDHKETDKGYELTIQGVPVHFQIIKRNYQFFRTPETRFFGVVEFLIPNPLDKYLKAQYIIK